MPQQVYPLTAQKYILVGFQTVIFPIQSEAYAPPLVIVPTDFNTFYQSFSWPTSGVHRTCRCCLAWTSHPLGDPCQSVTQMVTKCLRAYTNRPPPRHDQVDLGQHIDVRQLQLHHGRHGPERPVFRFPAEEPEPETSRPRFSSREVRRSWYPTFFRSCLF